MALLGGLLRGTSGAFIRGSLGAASDMLGQTALRDEEEIKEGVQGFGGKYDAYKKNIAAYQAESKTISEVADALRAQDDESLGKLDDKGLEGYAQELITLSGAENASGAVKYFIENRNKLNPVMVQPTSVATPKAPTVDAQTSTMLPGVTETPAEEPTKKNFLQRIFSGKSDDEIADAIARKAGVSREVYDTVMANNLPTRPESSVGISIGKDDPYVQIFKDNNTAVLGAIQKIRESRSDEGMQLAEQYVPAYAAYRSGADGAMSPEALLDLQNKIITFAAPKDASDFFGVYDEVLKSANALVLGKDSPLSQAVRDEALPLYKEILSMKSGVTTGKTTPDTALADSYSEKVFDLLEMIDIPGGEDPFKLVTSLVDDAVKHARTNSDQYTSENLELVFQMPQQVQRAITEGDTSMVTAIFNTLEGIIPEVADGGDSETDYMRKKADLTEFFMSREGGSMSKDEANFRAIDHLNSAGLVTIDGIPYRLNGDNTLSRLQIVAPDTKVPEPRYKTKQENMSTISRNTTSSNDIGRAIQLLGRNPNGFNIIGKVALRTQDVLDIAASMGINIQGIETNAEEIQEMQQRTIPLISAAKDRLFEDPRLSDQDLRIVLDYVAVINDAGIGSTRGLQALLGIQEALAVDTALRMYENDPTQTVATYWPDDHPNAGNFRITNDDGSLVLDESIAGRTMKQVATSQGITILDRDGYMALNATDRNRYDEQLFRVQRITERVISEVNTLRDLRGDSETYRQRYQNRGTLAPIPNVRNAANFRDEIDAGRSRFAVREAKYEDT